MIYIHKFYKYISIEETNDIKTAAVIAQENTDWGMVMGNDGVADEPASNYYLVTGIAMADWNRHVTDSFNNHDLPIIPIMSRSDEAWVKIVEIKSKQKYLGIMMEYDIDERVVKAYCCREREVIDDVMGIIMTYTRLVKIVRMNIPFENIINSASASNISINKFKNSWCTNLKLNV